MDVQRDLPAGELIIGINPPFGYLNKTAIEFVEHACCARPRLCAAHSPTLEALSAGFSEPSLDPLEPPPDPLSLPQIP